MKGESLVQINRLIRLINQDLPLQLIMPKSYPKRPTVVLTEGMKICLERTGGANKMGWRRGNKSSPLLLTAHHYKLLRVHQSQCQHNTILTSDSVSNPWFTTTVSRSSSVWRRILNALERKNTTTTTTNYTRSPLTTSSHILSEMKWKKLWRTQDWHTCLLKFSI